MRDAKWMSFFRRAVVLTLALPACGGTEVVYKQPPPDGGVLPTTPCSWAERTRSTCAWVLTFQGNANACAGFSGSGTASQCLAVCGSSDMGQAPDSCFAFDPDGGAGSVSCAISTGPACASMVPPGNGGRRPGYFASLGFGVPASGREVGTHFARVACMEAGSVEAFRWLRDELIAHGAPSRLVESARRAIRDEMRHVRQTSALARRFGEEPIAPFPSPPRLVRPLLAMALENAVEGCVRETYSALECAWQGEVAEDPVVRATMKRIAKDEMRHLALAWAVHGWAMGRLEPGSRDTVRAAQAAEAERLSSELATDPHRSLLRAAGLPRAFQSRALVAAIASKIAA